MVPQSSNRGISSSSNISLGIFPQNTSHPFPGTLPSQLGGGPPYLRCPVEIQEAVRSVFLKNSRECMASYLLLHPMCIRYAPVSFLSCPRPVPSPVWWWPLLAHPAGWHDFSGDRFS